MCKIPKVVVVGPSNDHLGYRKTLSSVEYEVIATVTDPADVPTCDVAVTFEADQVESLRSAAAKVVLVGDGEADLLVTELVELKTRIWELYRPER